MLKVRNVSKSYNTLFGKNSVTVLNNISFDVKHGDFLGVIGESGSGKTTLAKILLGLILPDSGTLYFDNYDLLALKGKRLRKIRQSIQTITQNYETALNPRMTIRESLKEVFLLKDKKHFAYVQDKTLENLLTNVGLQKEHLDRYPSQLSGGELQRVIIARIIYLEPKLIIADEPTSNLDLLSQAQIMHLMKDYQKKTKASIIFISHDQDLVSLMCKKVMVLNPTIS